MTNLIAGDRAPDVAFELRSGNVTSPTDFRGQKLVLFFCNGSEPSACSHRLFDFAELAADFAQTGTWIMGLISGDVGSTDHFMLPDPPIIPVALDQRGAVGRAFGLGAGTGRIDHAQVEAANATFLIDRDGTIDRIWRRPIDAREVLEAARELT